MLFCYPFFSECLALKSAKRETLHFENVKAEFQREKILKHAAQIELFFQDLQSEGTLHFQYERQIFYCNVFYSSQNLSIKLYTSDNRSAFMLFCSSGLNARAHHISEESLS